MWDVSAMSAIEMSVPSLSCQAVSWLDGARAGSCLGGLVPMRAWDAWTSTTQWMLCSQHHEMLTLCEGCGRVSALGPGTLLYRCLPCIRAIEQRNEAGDYVPWTPVTPPWNCTITK